MGDSVLPPFQGFTPLWLALLIGMKWTQKSSSCPTECTCEQWRVSCTGKNLSVVPSKIPLTTKELMLQKNNITSLPPIDLNYLSELVYLDCSQNQLTLDLHFAFTGTAKLIYLDLSVNRIAYISHHTLSQLEKLMLLNLSSNPNLTLIEKEAFRGNPLLMYLDVSGCGLKHVDDDVFEHLSNLHTLGINNNPWRCDCALLEFCTWIEETTIELTKWKNEIKLNHHSHKLASLQTLPTSSVKNPRPFGIISFFGMVQHGLHFACLVHLQTHDFLIMVLIAFCIFVGGIFVAWLVGISTVMYYHPTMKADDESDEEECRMT